MEFLNKLVLPQSAEHIQLLHYIIMLVMALFVPFISVLFGGTFTSIHFGKKFRRTKTLYYKKFSKDVIEYATVNNLVGIILGLVPVLVLILIYAQLLNGAAIQTTSFLAVSFVFLLIGIFMIYTYRYSMMLSNVIAKVNLDQSIDKEEEADFRKIKAKSSYLSLNSGKFGLVFLFIGIWFFIAATTSAVNFTTWNFPGLIISLAAPKVLLNFLIFLIFSFTLTAGLILFLHFFWNEKNEKEESGYSKFVKDSATQLGLRSSVLLPDLILINLFSIQKAVLSGSVFIYTIAGLLLIFLSYHFFYLIKTKNEYQHSSLIFFVLVLSVLAFIIKDQKIMSSSTKGLSLTLSTKYDLMLAELKGENKPAALSGAEIYAVRCASCHKFEQKLVGPAHFDVLPKYVGKEAQLIAFIRNPVKVNPAFPPMPNPGLKPQEAEAVAKYLLEEFAKKK